MPEALHPAPRVQHDYQAHLSHSLSTPLKSLIPFSEDQVDGSLKTSAERSRAATVVHEESERVLRMAQELLDLARVEAGTISMHISAVDLAAQLEQEQEIARPRAKARYLMLEADVNADLPPVAADPERLHQVLGNLLDNAVKYAPARTPVRISAYSSVSGVETVISNALNEHRPDPERMFDRFYRADASRSAAAGGVGLGLAISKELVSAMKGRLWADFDADGNLRMHLLLPASARPEARTTPTPASLPAASR
jgi:signal transduction histidine kinase